ncbi:hypothetical protein BDV93DRAFT_602433 [Ceratobasidium sp. AG-I]|nr:hypothetical protein BDV93DRAFT_602433 [Ceratobasidium sp. AG-I]
MFRSQKSARGEEEKLLGRTSLELTTRSAVSPTPTTPTLAPSPQPTSPLSVSAQNPHFLGAYETLGRSQSLKVHEKSPSANNLPGSTVPVLGSPVNFAPVPKSHSIAISDPFTGEPKARLLPDHDDATSFSWPLPEGSTTGFETQDKFWAHVAKIRELQSEVARMHISMESIGRPSEPQPPKPKEKEKDKHKEGRKYRGTTPSSGRTGTTSTAINTDKDETGQSASDTDHAGSGRENRAGTKKTTPPAEVPVAPDTGEHFAKRKEVIQDIVKKLNALSDQVAQFHELPKTGITFPISPTSPTHHTHTIPQTPPQPSTLTIPSPTPPSGAHQASRSKAGQVQRHSPLGLHGQHITRISIPGNGMPALGSQTQPTTPSRTHNALSIISGDGTLHESPINS